MRPELGEEVLLGKTEIAQGPADGAYIYGLYLEQARWDPASGILAEQRPGQPSSAMAVIHFLPRENRIETAKSVPPKSGEIKRKKSRITQRPAAAQQEAQ